MTTQELSHWGTSQWIDGHWVEVQKPKPPPLATLKYSRYDRLLLVESLGYATIVLPALPGPERVDLHEHLGLALARTAVATATGRATATAASEVVVRPPTVTLPPAEAMWLGEGLAYTRVLLRPQAPPNGHALTGAASLASECLPGHWGAR